MRRSLPLLARLREDARLIGNHRSRLQAGGTFEALFDDVEGFAALLERFAGRRLSGARVFEIGFGARPYRLRICQAMGADVSGVDAEVPVISGRAGEYVAMLRRNGWERALKTAARHVLFDRAEQAQFCAALADRGLAVPAPDSYRFLIGNAADADPRGPFDLIYSIAVFEHIDRVSLERLVGRMARWLAPHGIALIVPDVFTGLHGGHLLDWDGACVDLDAPRRSEPWEHLRRRRFTPNTYLNEMTRGEYTALFERHLRVLEIIDRPRGPAATLLTPEIRAELSQYSEQDLLDATPTYVLARK